MLDALSETSTKLQAAENKAAKPEQVKIPAETGAFKDDSSSLNTRREYVVLLPSGVQYEVLKQSSGKQPGEDDAVLVNYEASLTNAYWKNKRPFHTGPAATLTANGSPGNHSLAPNWAEPHTRRCKQAHFFSTVVLTSARHCLPVPVTPTR